MKYKKGYGWLELVLGVLLVIVGIYSFIRPLASLEAFVIVYGAIALFTGLVDISLYFGLEVKNSISAVTLVGGILSVIVGFMILFWPNAGVWVMTILFPIWFIAHCIARLSNLGMLREYSGNGSYYISMFINILGILLGVLILFSPIASALSIAYLIGLYLMLLGIGSVCLAIFVLTRK